MLRRHDPFREIEHPREVVTPRGYGKRAASEVRFEYRSWHRSEPGSWNAPLGPLGMAHVARAQRTPCTHFLQDGGHVLGLLSDKLLESIGAHPVRGHTITEQRPRGHRYDRRLMRPLL